MFGFLWVLAKFIRSIGRSMSDPEFRALVILVMVMLAVGTFFYSNVEGWSLFNSLYFCVITLATIGYGDFTPHTVLGKAFTIIYVILGIGILLGFIDKVAAQADGGMPILRARITHRRTQPGNSTSSDHGEDVSDAET